MKKKLLLLALLCVLTAQAQIKLQPMFSDNMVLQQKTNAPIWGETKPGKQVTVTTSWNKRQYIATADQYGRFQVEVATPKAGGPYNITIKTDNEQRTLQNVLIGEVWLCTGQSNMEMPLAAWGFIDNYEQEIANADQYPRIRIINMKHVISPLPRTDIVATTEGWEVCSAKTIPGFSAAGYFFAVNLQKSLNVPVGLIATNWGGTLAESWTSEESLRQMPYFRDAIDKVKTLPADAEEANKKYVQEEKAYWKAIKEGELGIENGTYLWAAADYNDAAWNKIHVPGKIENYGLSGFDGAVWIRNIVNIPKAWEGHELTLNLGAIDDEDNTFFNGKEIGHTDSWFAHRTYTVPAELVKAGPNTIAIRIMDTGGDGGLTGNDKDVFIACGNDKIGLADNWKYKISVDLRNFPPKPVNMANNPNVPTVLYNSMLNPIVGYALKGAIWYQGESNVDRAFQYRELLPIMINDWRTKWGTNLDFYIVQLANFMRQQTEPEESTWAELREAQMWTAQHLKNTGIACAIDIGLENDIHPKNKQEVGRRLALAALAQTYGKKLDYSGPINTGYEIEGNKIRLHFDHAEGMRLPEGNVFTVAGADQKFYWAKAKLEGNTIVVWADQVPFPVAARYAWANNPMTSALVYNAADLPMYPFRTDQWPGITTRIR